MRGVVFPILSCALSVWLQLQAMLSLVLQQPVQVLYNTTKNNKFRIVCRRLKTLYSSMRWRAAALRSCRSFIASLNYSVAVKVFAFLAARGAF